MFARMLPTGLRFSHWCARANLTGLALLLTGCASLQKPDAPAPAASEWTGRFAMVVHSTPVRSQRASFELRGNEQHGALDVLSPIGTTVVRATWQPGKATLISGGQYTHYTSLEALSASLGESDLPLTDLFNWLQGKAPPTPPPPTAQGGEASAWVVDLCQAHIGRIKATRDHPWPALSLTVLFQPPAPNTQADCTVPVDTAHSK